MSRIVGGIHLAGDCLGVHGGMGTAAVAGHEAANRVTAAS